MRVTAINKDVPAVAARSWIKDSLVIYSKSKFYFSLFSIFSTIIIVIPILGAFMVPIFTAKYAEIAIKIEKDQEFSFVEFFYGLFTNKTILKIGGFHMVFYIIATTLQIILQKTSDPTSISSEVIEIFCILVGLFIVLIFLLVFWLSPIICLRNSEVNAINALNLSFKACVVHRNKIIIWGVLVFILGGAVLEYLYNLAMSFQQSGSALLAALSGTIGIAIALVWAPVMHLSAYYVYKSLFLNYNEQ